MKNKKLLYILIPSVVFVWGMILYRIFATPAKDEAVFIPSGTRQENDQQFVADTFYIANNYRDPFELEVPRPRSVNTQAIKEIKKAQVSPTNTPWPQVAYTGLIRNQQSKKELAMVQINGQENFMRVGERIQDVELLKLFKDSIQVRYGKSKKTVRK